MNDRIRLITKDRFIFYSFGVTLLLFVISNVLVFFSYANLPPLVPLLNSMPWGIDRLYVASTVLIIPLAMIGVIILNTIISLSIYKKFTLLGRIIFFNSLLFCLLGMLAYLQILFLIY